MVVKKSMNRVLFLDSGIGGLALMCRCKQRYKNSEFLYFADYQNMPYGQKSINFLRQHLFKTIYNLYQKFHFGIVVLACNTATSVAIQFLRKNMPYIIFIGIEPAVKQAYKLGYKKTLVLATENTILHNKLIKKMSVLPNFELILVPMHGLATKVEISWQNPGQIVRQLKPVFSKYKGTVDSVVLGCTHYYLIKTELKKYFCVEVFDGFDGVVDRLGEFIKNTAKKSKIIMLTNDSTKLFRIDTLWQYLANN